MAFPDEVMAGSWSAWIAPAATARPATPGTAPAAGYIVIGNQGSLNIPESGIVMRKTLEQEDWYSLGQPARIKSFTIREAFEVEFDMADMTLETISKLYGGPATAAGSVVDTPPASGIVGYRDLPIASGFQVRQFTLLLRKTESPYDGALVPGASTYASELWCPKVQSAGSAEFVWVKEAPAVAHFFYKTVFDASLGFGSYRFQDANAV